MLLLWFIILYWMLLLAGVQYMKKLNLMMGNKDNSLTIFLNKVQVRWLFCILWEIEEFLNKRNTINLSIFLDWWWNGIPLNLLNLPLRKSFDAEMIKHGFLPPGERSDIQIRLITVILKYLLTIMDVVLSSKNGKS